MARKYTRRQYLMLRAIMAGVPTGMLRQAVEEQAIAHPEWDMNKIDTWDGWKATREHEVSAEGT